VSSWSSRLTIEGTHSLIDIVSMLTGRLSSMEAVLKVQTPIF
jgi:hypothetical protein